MTATATDTTTPPNIDAPPTYVVTAYLGEEEFKLDLLTLLVSEQMWFEEQTGIEWGDVLYTEGGAFKLFGTKAKAAVVSLAGSRATGLKPGAVWKKVLATTGVKVELALPTVEDDEDTEDESVDPTSQSVEQPSEPAGSGTLNS